LSTGTTLPLPLFYDALKVCIEGLKKTTKDLSQDIRCLDRHLNLALPNIRQTVTATLTSSVKYGDGREKNVKMMMMMTKTKICKKISEKRKNDGDDYDFD
jgi:hypothetical protein